MGFLSGIGDAIKGAVGGFADAVGGIGKAVTSVTGMFKGIMDSPLGGLIASVFPPAGAIMGAVNMADMLGNVAMQVGGQENY